MDYLLHVVTVILIYIMLSASLNLVSGGAGLVSVAHAAFFGLGAYSAALIALQYGTSFPVNLGCAIVIAGAIGAGVGVVSTAVRGEYFIIATFAFQVIAFSILNNLVSWTGGPMGLPGIPQPTIFGWQISSPLQFLTLIGCCCVLQVWICHRILKSPIGRVLKGIREEETVVQALGKNVPGFKVLVFAIGAALAAVAGVLYAQYISFVDPTSFSVMESVVILTMVILGGAGSCRGAVVGAVVLIALPELLRFVGMPSAAAANVRQVFYGAALVGFMLWRPQGLFGEYTFEKGGS